MKLIGTFFRHLGFTAYCFGSVVAAVVAFHVADGQGGGDMAGWAAAIATIIVAGALYVVARSFGGEN